MSRHDQHLVAEWNPKRAHLWCVDCACSVNRDDYCSPYKSGEAPAFIFKKLEPGEEGEWR